MTKLGLARGVLVLTALLVTTGCPNPLDEVTATIQQAIDKLAQQSEEWQQTLTKLEQDLVRQGQSLIANEITQLAERGVATTGTELRCDADFVGNRMREGLTAILDKLKKKQATPLKQYFCQVVPTQINLGLNGSQRPELDFYGYNLDAGAVKVSVVNNKGEERPIPNNEVATPTHYLMTINISVTNGVPLYATDQQIVFRINGGGEQHAVNVVAPPAKVFSIPDQSDASQVDGGGGGGGPTDVGFGVDCPTGSAGTGLQGTSGGGGIPDIDNIQLVCNHLNSDGTTGSTSLTAVKGGDGRFFVGTPFTQSCPAGQLLVGIYGMADSFGVHQVGGQCQTPGDVVATTGAASMTGLSGGAAGSSFAATCKPTFVVAGLVGSTPGAVLDHIGIICKQIVSN